MIAKSNALLFYRMLILPLGLMSIVPILICLYFIHNFLLVLTIFLSLPLSPSSAFHVYSVEWSPTRLDFLMDGALYGSRLARDVVLPTSPMVRYDGLMSERSVVDGDVFPCLRGAVWR